MNDSLNILIITHSYWPKNSPRSFRWTELAEHFVQCGHRVDVMASRPFGWLKEECRRGVRIFRALDCLQAVKALFLPAGDEAEISFDFKVSSQKWWKYICEKFYAFMVRGCYWPDASFLWIMPAFFKSRSLWRKRAYDVVITVAHPFSAHVVGFLLAPHRRGARWICDYGDPFSTLIDSPPNNFRFYARLNKWMEKKILTASKRIAVTTDATAKQYSQTFGVPLEWFATIGPLYDGPTGGGCHHSQVRLDAENCKRLLFVGTFYKRIRNPSFLLSLVQRMQDLSGDKRIILDIVGDVRECADEFAKYVSAVNQWLFIHGKVSRERIQEYLINADVLVNVSNSNVVQLPSKIVEYIATGKPILNIASVPGDLATAELGDYPAAFTILEGDGSIDHAAAACLRFIDNTSNVEEKVVARLLERYLTPVIAEKYLSLMYLS